MASQELVRLTWSADPGTPVSVMASNEVIYNNGNNDAKYVSNNTTIYNSAIYIRNNNTIYVLAFGEQSFTVSYGGGSKTFNAKVGNYYGTGIQNDNGIKYMYAMMGWGSFSNIQSPTVPVFTDYDEFIAYCTTPYVSAIPSNGGGATHIAKVTGQLSALSSNLSDILMISGGGGGGLIIGEDVYAGKDAGGISGSGDNSANQTTGYAFGQGESGEGVSGGGGGLYGGYKGVNS